MNLPVANMRNIAISAILLCSVAAGVYALGRRDGSADTRTDDRKAQLQELRQQALDYQAKIQRAEVRKEQRAAQTDTARTAYVAARERIHIVDTTSLQIDSGPVLELPAPVIQLVQRGDELIRRDSLEKVSLVEWGNLWKGQAETQRIRGDVLEEELKEEKRRGRRARIKDVIIAAAAGALGGVLLH